MEVQDYVNTIKLKSVNPVEVHCFIHDREKWCLECKGTGVYFIIEKHNVKECVGSICIHKREKIDKECNIGLYLINTTF
jgi:DnaJ-class molecular chaperone